MRDRLADEFRRADSSVLGERTGHLMKISDIVADGAHGQGISVFVRDDGRAFHTDGHAHQH
jgi:hypothetical protein